MLKPSLEQRALARATEEARRSATPELGDAFEAELLARIADGQQKASIHPARHRIGRWSLALVPAVAAALALAVLWTSRPSPEPPAAAVRDLPANVDGDALAPERVLLATEHPLTVVHAGRAEWQLDPGSSASLVDHADGIHVRLTHGTLRARVVPGQKPDRFVVEVGDLRVAVRGTVFRVELLEGESRVTVDEGVVAVGPRTRPSAPTRLLRAPAEGTFRLDGALAEERVDHPAPRRSAAPVARNFSLPQPVASVSASSSPSLPRQLTIGEVEAGISAVVKTLSECFEKNTSGAQHVRISARTTLTLDVAADGGVAHVNFAPPLAPAVHACSERSLAGVRFAPSDTGGKVTRVLEFVR